MSAKREKRKRAAMQKQNEEKKNRKVLEPKTRNQRDYIRDISECDVTVCCGPPGSGKSHIAVGMACQYLLDDSSSINKIVISRPVVETGGRGLGYLPGTMGAKMAPYVLPIKEELKLFLGRSTIDTMIGNGSIEICPLEYMRGRNFHNSFMILDEAQNADLDQLIMFLTRIGFNSKAVVEGDLNQTDLGSDSGLGFCMDRLEKVSGVGVCELDHGDIVRNGIISDILDALN